MCMGSIIAISVIQSKLRLVLAVRYSEMSQRIRFHSIKIKNLIKEQ